MKISNIKNLNKDAVLSALGLISKPSTTHRIFGTLGLFGVGLLAGAGIALLVAPKAGLELREDLGQRFKKIRGHGVGTDDEGELPETDSARRMSRRDEART